MKQHDRLLHVPEGIGRSLVEAGELMLCPLLRAEDFCRYATERGLRIDRERLHRFEMIGALRPVFRARVVDSDSHQPIEVPLVSSASAFDDGRAWDTTSDEVPAVPALDDRSCQAYYSIFQVDQLRLLLSEFSLTVQLDGYLEPGRDLSRLLHNLEKLTEQLRTSRRVGASSDFRFSLALLCQAISNRYFPITQGDGRTIVVTEGGFSWDQWVTVNGQNWRWNTYARGWDPQVVARRFALTPERLRHAYETLAGGQAGVDPLERWYPLVQFVSPTYRGRLKGDALFAETLRCGALMLRALFKDLYGADLPPVNEVHGTVIRHVPELEVRQDPRRHLEFVANRFGVNPQPKLVLLVEGLSEEQMVLRVFNEYFGFPPGRCSIEVVVLGGVDNATGNRREDRYQAILRLLDYLHHHQSLTFLILDNENQAKRLKEAARDKLSIHGHRRHVTRAEYIRVWRRTFELDNFSDTELAVAMARTSEGRCDFRARDLRSCRQSEEPGSALSQLYKSRCGYSLPKLALANHLADLMLAPDASKAVANRPLIKVLQRVVRLATKNPLPVMQEIWEKNQASKVLATKAAKSRGRK
jgi:hypothetical protein